MKLNSRVPPVWVMGLSNATFGFFGGIAYFALPQLLAERHVPEARIAGITDAVLFASIWTIVFVPMLDVWFSRRFYATVFAGLSSVLLVVSLLSMDKLAVLEVAMVAGSAAAVLFGGALGGWLSTVCGHSEESKLSAWMTIANTGAGGITAFLGGELVNNLPLPLAAVLLGALIFSPTIIFLFIPSKGPDGKLASESFRQFAVEVASLFKQRAVLVAMLMFVLPSGSFALTNILGGFGGEFHASQHMISLIGGVGMVATGIVGSLLVPVFAKRFPLRPLYLANGIVGAVFTLSLVLMPHAPWTFALANIGENVFQAMSFTTGFAITFETIGRNNPLAATTFAVLTATANIPITYMLKVDSHAYDMHGVAGSFIVDAVVGLVVCVLLFGVLAAVRRGEAKAAEI